MRPRESKELSEAELDGVAESAIDFEIECIGIYQDTSEEAKSTQSHSVPGEQDPVIEISKSADDFVNFLSKCNITTHSAISGQSITTQGAKVLHGNSRDPLTAFEYQCRTTWNNQQCTYQTVKRKDFNTHVTHCTAAG
ncbi:hypothetical protein GJ744_007935 [Endocarpon pusillum]|uniref:Uncharacterized protein n=1 Tax=Endocarpon pusillum TaxID=364733 RepID=A0A8H7AI51_9EURO|nr:hypothetical protein GJ744_007935 [Endocarpon pusillum]